MWGKEGGSNQHFGALEVVEGNDPKYIYGQSFGYGDILEKGKIPGEKIYPNFEGHSILAVIVHKQCLGTTLPFIITRTEANWIYISPILLSAKVFVFSASSATT